LQIIDAFRIDNILYFKGFHGLPEKPLPPNDWPKYYNLYQADGVTLFKMEETPLYKAYCGEEVNNIEMVIISTDGQKRNLMASGERITSKVGRILGAVCIMQDITQKKREEELNNQLLIQETAAREALRQEKILLQLFQEAPAPVAMLKGEELTFTLVNNQYQNLFPGRKLLVFLY
jgi:hypothetical protein